LTYRDRRAREYPNIGDQLDAVLKYLETKNDLTFSINEIINEWNAVKVKYPKPETE